jgi:hypothetical protein
VRQLVSRRPRLAFFALGFLVTAAAFWLPLYLVKKSHNLAGWISIVLWIAQLAPWIAIMGMLGLRVARGPVMRIDAETLVFKLGPDGRVADYRIVRD